MSDPAVSLNTLVTGMFASQLKQRDPEFQMNMKFAETFTSQLDAERFGERIKQVKKLRKLIRQEKAAAAGTADDELMQKLKKMLERV